MKTPQDPRHERRRHIVSQLFTLSFDQPNTKKLKEIAAITAHLPDLDQKITAAAPEWPIKKISKIDLAILRLALFELTIERKEPPKVIIDEAVELAKELGNDSSSGFVNGVLGTILKSEV